MYYIYQYISLFTDVYLFISTIYLSIYIVAYLKPNNTKWKSKTNRNLKTIIYISEIMQSKIVAFFSWSLSTFIPEGPPRQQALRCKQ